MPPKKDDGAALKQLKKSLKENTLGHLIPPPRGGGLSA